MAGVVPFPRTRLFGHDWLFLKMFCRVNTDAHGSSGHVVCENTIGTEA